MTITGIIAEYNPFHNGHEYMIQKIKEETQADYVIILMSGDFTQRGIPGIADKFARAKMAVSCGADAVFELPVRFATACAESFATGAVSMLKGFSCIDYLAFGSEKGTLSDFDTIADCLLSEPEAFSDAIRHYQKQGHSYPKAFTMATKELGQIKTVSEELLSSPNNLLGLEYVKALKKIAPAIRPHTITRTGTGYHDTHSAYSDKADNLIASAGAIRSLLETKTGSIAAASPLLPEAAYRIFSDSYGIGAPITMDDFSLLLSFRLSLETPESLQQYLDVSTDLANRIYGFHSEFRSFTELISAIKHKQYTYARINRALLHILLDLKNRDNTSEVPYARLLAMRRSSSALIKHIRNHSQIPVITKAADAKKVLSSEGLLLFSEDLFAADLYSRVAANKFQSSYTEDIRRSIELV